MDHEPPPSLKGLERLGWILALVVAASLVWVASVAAPGPAGTPPASGTYVLTLVETMDNLFNASAPAQPRFFVMSANGLVPATMITIPSDTDIELVIMSYDMGASPPPPSYDQVTGTTDGRMTLINGTTASGTDPTASWGANVSSVPGSMIAHTFTVPSLNLNIPVVSGDTEIAHFTAHTKGTYTWLCATPCGTGADGMGGAMAAQGWMLGQLTVT